MLLLLQSCILLKSTDFELNNQETGLVSDCSNPTETVVSSVIDIAMGCPLLSTEDPNGLYNHFESYQLELPDEICTLEIEFNSSNLIFDDHVIFALNEHILFLSDATMANYFASDNNGYQYSWEQLQGNEMNTTFNPLCTVPCNQIYNNTNETIGYGGSFQQHYEEATIADLLPNLNQAVLSVIALGDNDEEDCWVEGLEYTLRFTAPN